MNNTTLLLTTLTFNLSELDKKSDNPIILSVFGFFALISNFSKSFPFPCYSDLKKWEGKIVQDYYVFSTPTMFLLDNKREIILRPTSVKQMDAWVDWYLGEGDR